MFSNESLSKLSDAEVDELSSLIPYHLMQPLIVHETGIQMERYLGITADVQDEEVVKLVRDIQLRISILKQFKEFLTQLQHNRSN